MLRAVLFDFNGVLVDDEPLHFALFARVLDEEGLALSEEDYYAKYVGFDDKACFAAVLKAVGEEAGLGRLMRLITRKSSYYQQTIREQGYPFFAGAVELVRELAAAPVMLGVVSGALREEVEGALAQEGIAEAFKVLVTAEDVEASKPDPEGYRRALEALNELPPRPERLIHPHEALVLEDTPAGIEAAGAVGLSAVAIAHTYPEATLTAALAAAVPGGGAVVGTVGELSLERLQALVEGS
jgi:HAD superfamily hydrolase (TIGR01509 family)